MRINWFQYIAGLIFGRPDEALDTTIVVKLPVVNKGRTNRLKLKVRKMKVVKVKVKRVRGY